MCVYTVCFYMCVKLFLYMHSDTMNTTHQESIKMTSYEPVFGQKARRPEVRQRQTLDQACSL